MSIYYNVDTTIISIELSDIKFAVLHHGYHGVIQMLLIQIQYHGFTIIPQPYIIAGNIVFSGRHY